MTPAPVVPTLDWLIALHEPDQTLTWTLHRWSEVVRLARRLRLLGRLAHSIDAAGLTSRMPEQVQLQLLAESRLSAWRTRALTWTMSQVSQQFQGADYPRVLLKGGAYMAQDLAIARGRLPSDLDILVPRPAIADAQRRLREHGWREIALDAHDQRYYHEWSHETPPMRNMLFGLELDLHHNILPPVARTAIDAQTLFDNLAPSGLDGWQILSPADQVLHCAAHLFLDSDLRDRARDIVDFDGLLRHHADKTDFWPQLVQRAEKLSLMQPLQLALRFGCGWMQTPLPDAAREELARQTTPGLRQRWLLPLLDVVLTPTHPDRAPSLHQRLAAIALLARHHRQRMPARLLLPHIWHKLRSSQPSEREVDGGG